MIEQRDDLLRMVKGKRIAIVGPSPHMLGKGAGDFIDGCDLVCRVNDIIPPLDIQKDYGSRTDILFHNLATTYLDSIKEKKQKNEEFYDRLKMIICPVVKSSHLDNNWQTWGDDKISDVVTNYKEVDEERNTPFYWIGVGDYKKIYNLIGCEPGCGILAIVMLLEYPIEELIISGFSFYLGGNRYQDNYHESHFIDKHKVNRTFGIHGAHGFHANKRQIEFFRNYILTQHKNTVIIDSYIRSLLNVQYENVFELGRNIKK